MCGYPTVPLYHVIGNNYTDRIFTTDPTVVENALDSGAYFSSNVLAYVYSNTTGWNVPNAVPLYGLDNVPETDHYLTTSWSEVESAVSSDGVEYQGVIAYVYNELPADCAGAVPFYRTYNPQLTVHFYTPSYADEMRVVNDDGYQNEGIAAYLFPPT